MYQEIYSGPCFVKLSFWAKGLIKVVTFRYAYITGVYEKSRSIHWAEQCVSTRTMKCQNKESSAVFNLSWKTKVVCFVNQNRITNNNWIQLEFRGIVFRIGLEVYSYACGVSSFYVFNQVPYCNNSNRWELRFLVTMLSESSMCFGIDQ